MIRKLKSLVLISLFIFACLIPAGSFAAKEVDAAKDNPEKEIKSCYAGIRYYCQKAYLLIDCIIRKDLFGGQEGTNCNREHREYKEAIVKLKKACPGG